MWFRCVSMPVDSAGGRAVESITRMIGIDYMAENKPLGGGRDRIVMRASCRTCRGGRGTGSWTAWCRARPTARARRKRPRPGRRTGREPQRAGRRPRPAAQGTRDRAWGLPDGGRASADAPEGASADRGVRPSPRPAAVRRGGRRRMPEDPSGGDPPPPDKSPQASGHVVATAERARPQGFERAGEGAGAHERGARPGVDHRELFGPAPVRAYGLATRRPDPTARTGRRAVTAPWRRAARRYASRRRCRRRRRGSNRS